MAVLATGARVKGVKDKTTAAARVRRSLKAARPMRISNAAIPAFDAVRRLCDEADRAQNAMHDEGLDPNDINLAVVYSKPEKVEMGFKLVPEPGQVGSLLMALEKIEAETPLLFLGIIWDQHDREAEAKGKPGHVVWVTQWMAGRLAEAQLRILRDIVTRPQN